MAKVIIKVCVLEDFDPPGDRIRVLAASDDISVDSHDAESVRDAEGEFRDVLAKALLVLRERPSS